MSSTPPKNRKQHLKVTGASADPSVPLTGEFAKEVERAEKEMEELRQRQNKLAREQEALREIAQKKAEFVEGQIEITEKYTAALAHMDREIFDMKQEVADLEQTKKSFEKHLKLLDAIDASKFKRTELPEKLDKALSQLDQAEDEFHMASDYFSEAKSGVFGSVSKSSGAGLQQSWFKTNILGNTPFLVVCALFLIYYLFSS